MSAVRLVPAQRRPLVLQLWLRVEYVQTREESVRRVFITGLRLSVCRALAGRCILNRMRGDAVRACEHAGVFEMARSIILSISTNAAIKSTEMKVATSVTYKTASLADMERGIDLYNRGLYGCVKNPDLDDRARRMFADGLGLAREKIFKQVRFIGKDYGGVAGPTMAPT